MEMSLGDDGESVTRGSSSNSSVCPTEDLDDTDAATQFSDSVPAEQEQRQRAQDTNDIVVSTLIGLFGT
jgi:hypothetical protein